MKLDLTLAIGLLSLGLAGAAAAEATSPVRFDGPLPQQVDHSPIQNQERAVVAVDRARLLRWIINVPLEDIFDEYSMLPRIVRTEPITSHWGKVTSRRRVVLADGHQAAEEILHISEGRAFSYMVFGFTNAAGYLAEYAIGQFELHDHPRGTEIVWTYSYYPRNLLTRVPLYIFVRKTWNGYMETSLANLTGIVNQQFGASAERE